MENSTKTFTVSPAQPVFAGHFPDYPILPGVLLLAFARDTLAAATGRPWRVKAIIRQKFLEPVLPGDEVRVECELNPEGNEAGHKAVCRFLNRDARLVARGDYLLETAP